MRSLKKKKELRLQSGRKDKITTREKREAMTDNLAFELCVF